MSSSPSSPPDPSVKRITLTGSAAADLSGGQLKKERKRSVKKSVTGGESAPASLTPSAPSAPPTPASVTPSTPASLTPAASLAPTASLTPISITEGGTKRIRVELKKRISTKKVHLQPKGVKKVSVLSSSPASSSSPSAPSSASSSAPSSASQTKKSRKVTLGVKALHKRMTRAKKMTRKVKEMSLTQLREHLIQKKLIKPTSKAPEAVLRQMAADAQIVAGKAL